MIHDRPARGTRMFAADLPKDWGVRPAMPDAELIGAMRARAGLMKARAEFLRQKAKRTKGANRRTDLECTARGLDYRADNLTRCAASIEDLATFDRY